jgi:hypothetical protein
MADKADKQNSAFRLYRFIQKMIPQHPQNMQTSQALLNAFGVPKDTPPRDQNAALARIMVLLFGELESLVSALQIAGHSEEAIQSIARPFDSLSGGGLANHWQNNVQSFSQSLPVLRFAGESLPEDGESITSEELIDLTNSIETLRTQVQETTLPEQVKRFVYEQLNIIKRAIRDYPLSGPKAFKTAVQEAVFHIGEHSEVVAEIEKTPIMDSLKAIQEQAVKYAKYVIEVSKFIGALDALYHHALQAAPATEHLTGIVKHVVGR